MICVLAAAHEADGEAVFFLPPQREQPEQSSRSMLPSPLRFGSTRGCLSLRCRLISTNTGRPGEHGQGSGQFFRFADVFSLCRAPATTFTEVGGRLNERNIGLGILDMKFFFNVGTQGFFIITHETPPLLIRQELTCSAEGYPTSRVFASPHDLP